ncbi:Ca-activated chloride channel family protein [Abditibacterium utsteinense]|uniref:Ca-activated chloride channel family protein n=1 Tax=Abditibacterium utsteinense TaxID=1960156 RepID=A0A2S8SXF5_9BACT|nr:VIT domain-containing protein [Abditibacterium utsteinense]PQV65448.1 Ca-activated chloride channel family protein [Abditibacterium utsteinense]
MRKWPLFLAATGFCCALLTRGGAQIVAPEPPDFPPRRPRPPFPWPRPIPPSLTALKLESQNAKVEIRGPLASVHLRQTLRNPTERALEGSYLFALPPGAAVSNFAMTMNGKRLDAEILDGDKAREIYQGIVQKMRDPAIFEFVGRGVARVKIFPVPARGNVEIELDYAQSIEGNRFDLPLRSPQNAGDKDQGNAAKSSVEINLQGADLRAIYSPTHKIETRRNGQKTVVSGEFSDSEKDFSLLWTRGQEKIGLDLFAGQTVGEDGTFLLLAAPDSAISKAEIEAKDVIFVFDTSGSMEGEKIGQARRALKTLLGSLSAKDRFGIVTFSSSARFFRENMVDASKTNLDAARTFADGIKALGGTNISEALQSAFKMTQKSARPQQIVFLTDGQPTVGQTNIDAILQEALSQNASKARVFTFGLGNDVNARLLDALASDNRGAADYVAPEEDIEVKVGALYEKIAFPVLADAQIDFGGLSVTDVYPPKLPDLFKGSQVTVFGRFHGALPQKISLTGQSNGQMSRFAGRVSPYASNDLPKLWATRKIGYLLEDARRQNRAVEGEVREEILKLSQKYGIVTPLTAALITEDGALPLSSSVFRSKSGIVGMAGNRTFNGNVNGAPRNNIPRAMQDSALFSARGQLAESGAAGIAASQKTRALREGRAEAAQGVKIIEGKTFTLVNGVWTDSDFEAKSTKNEERVVKFASNEYFELIRNPKLAQWLSVGERVVVVWNRKVLRIEP